MFGVWMADHLYVEQDTMWRHPAVSLNCIHLKEAVDLRMLKKTVTFVDTRALVDAYNKSKPYIGRLKTKLHTDNTSVVVDSMVAWCKKLFARSDSKSKDLYNAYRDVVIGNYSLYFVSVYNAYAKQYGVDANDLVHLPYVHFDTLVSNYKPDCGVSFNSYMVSCLHGYIKRFIGESGLVYVNPAKKTSVSYVGIAKTGCDGEEIEFLPSIEPLDADTHGKLQFASKIIESFPRDVRDMYGYLVSTESPKLATDIYADAHHCSKDAAVLVLTRLRRKIKKEWKTRCSIEGVV